MGALDKAFIARDRPGGAIPEGFVANLEGAGLDGPARLDTAFVAADEVEATVLAGAVAGAGAEGAEVGAADRAFCMSGTIVALEAGFRRLVWSMTKSNPALATT